MEIPFCRTDENEIEESEENLTVVTSAITELTNTENDVTLPVTIFTSNYNILLYLQCLSQESISNDQYCIVK